MSASVHPSDSATNTTQAPQVHVQSPPPDAPPVTSQPAAQTRVESSSASGDNNELLAASGPYIPATDAPQPTPLHSEPAQMLSAVEGGELEHRVTPTPASAIDYHQPADTHQYYYAQPPAETIQRAAITPIQPQPIQPPPHAPVLDPNAEGVLESDPAITSLHAMFPDFDLFVLQSVLEAAGGDKDRAVDGLLSMSDPDFGRSQSQDQAQAIGAGGGNRVRTQTELDEEFARRLMLEEEQQANAGWYPTNEQYGYSAPYQQYQPRRSGEAQRPSNVGGGGLSEMTGGLQQQFKNFIGGARTGVSSQGHGGSGGGYQDQLNKIAETGKKTFNTFVGKVKQKMEEFDNRHPSDTQHMNQPPQAGHWSSWQAPQSAQPQQQAPSMQSPPPQHGALNANPYGLPTGASGSAHDAGSALPTSSGRWQYQPEQPEQPEPTGPPVAGAVVGASSSTEEPRRSIDASRLGLLPKRPVSLVSPNTNPGATQPQGTNRTRDSDEDFDASELTPCFDSDTSEAILSKYTSTSRKMQDNGRRVLEVPELLTSVARKLDRNQRLGLMLVSRFFFNSVGPLVWKFIPRIDRVLKLITGTKVQFSRFMDSQGAHFAFTEITITLPDQPDLTRFNIYAPWVRRLEIFGGGCSQDIRNSGPLLNILTGRPLLPNLRTLTTHIGAEISSKDLLWFINLCFSPTLVEIRTILHKRGLPSRISPAAAPGFLQNIRNTCPQIEILEFYPEDSEYGSNLTGVETYYIPGNEYRITLASFLNLRSFTSTMYILQPETFSVLGNLPNLESLGIHGCREYDPVLAEGMNVPETWFPMLKIFRLNEVHPLDITILWNQPTIARKLISIWIHADPTSPPDSSTPPTDGNNWIDLFLTNLPRLSPNAKNLVFEMEDEDDTIFALSPGARDALNRLNLKTCVLKCVE